MVPLTADAPEACESHQQPKPKPRRQAKKQETRYSNKMAQLEQDVPMQSPEGHTHAEPDAHLLEIIADKDITLAQMRDTEKVMRIKISRLEQLLELKDQKIDRLMQT